MARGSTQIRKGPRGVAYRVRVEYGPDPLTGQRKQRSKTFLVRREAEAYLNRWQAEVERGIAVEPSTITVGEQFRYWLDTYARTSVSPQTFSEYERMVRTYIVPTLGAVPLQKLTVAHLEVFKGELLARGLGARTVTMCLMRLRQMLAQAIDLNLIAANPALCVQQPRVCSRGARTWSAEQARRFLAVATRSAYGPIWAVYLGSGMRRGEALGLRWQDVDFMYHTLRVEQTVGLERGRTVVKPKPKTEASRRTIAVDAAIIAALEEHRDRQHAQRVAADDAWQGHDLVFASSRGTPINPNNLLRDFQRLVAQADVPRIRIHDLRHTHITLAIQAGAPIAAVSRRAGHARVSTTMDIYAQVTPDMHAEVADRISALLFGPA
jgi:integrase